MKSKHYFHIVLFFLYLPFTGHTKAQEIIQIEPLFEYPMAPEELPSLVDKSDYLVKCFWDQFDFKNTKAVNQIALNDAFGVYLTPLRFSSERAKIQSLDNLINKISGNPTLLVQFAKAAEEKLYGPKAEIWSDDIYLRFLDAAIKSKKVSQSRRDKFKQRSDLIRSTSIDQPAPNFDFTDPKGNNVSYFPMSTPTILIFGDPDFTDWRLSRLRMETLTPLTQAVDKGKLNIIFISNTGDDNWKNVVADYPSKWIVGGNKEISNTYDLRAQPSVYLIGSDGKIIMKNVPVTNAIYKALEIVG